MKLHFTMIVLETVIQMNVRGERAKFFSVSDVSGVNSRYVSDIAADLDHKGLITRRGGQYFATESGKIAWAIYRGKAQRHALQH